MKSVGVVCPPTRPGPMNFKKKTVFTDPRRAYENGGGGGGSPVGVAKPYAGFRAHSANPREIPEKLCPAG